jgi:hypothetical protein
MQKISAMDKANDEDYDPQQKAKDEKYGQQQKPI